MLRAQDVANVLAPQGVPPGNVLANWPIIVEGLKWAGIDDHFTEVGAAATCVVETGTFKPIEEEGDQAYFERELGGDWYYHGRGYTQITWRSSYAHYGAELGVDLVAHPELALDPTIAAKVMALYFRERGIPSMANAGNWYGVRVAVNGGTTGWPVYIAAVNALLTVHTVPDGPPPAPITTVAVKDILRTIPKADGPHAIDQKRQEVVLPVGQVVTFGPDPSTGPYHGQETTVHWAHITVGVGPVHGWYPRFHLRTTVG